MLIAITFDESEKIDPIDPIGDITITDDTTTITEKSTYLDSWFDASITGLKTVKEGKKISVEIVEEPEPIVFEPWQEGVRISYRDRTLFIPQISEFTTALKLAANDFLNKLDRETEFDSNDLLEVIRDFVDNESEDRYSTIQTQSNSHLDLASAHSPARE
ncbi:hypothetical protein [Argonema antarcticum]|uniref:hypothetical protein n=1 Tax=Argonema antarcticum TaxID=2942763 RepID=UPI0020130EAC|nr:hypothetical protein [Argonema antarcticum]MCL1472946.1 hypothetical protein [Argonema antarcticum A004/B2]